MNAGRNSGVILSSEHYNNQLIILSNSLFNGLPNIIQDKNKQ